MGNTTMNGNELRCLNCGDLYAMAMPAPIGVVTAAWKAFDEDHRECRPSDRGKARMEASSPVEWLRSWDTGVSSKTIWYRMMGMSNADRNDIPYDPADFGRCYRLLEKFPEWRARMDEMRDLPRWAPLVDAWPEMERLWIEESARKDGRAPKLYVLMCRLRGVEP